MNYDIKVGFSRVIINPPMGTEIRGYYKERFVEGVLDDLQINAIAVNKGNKTILIMTVDNCSIKREYLEIVRKQIEAETSVAADAIFIQAVHSHTAPYIGLENESKTEQSKEYSSYCKRMFVNAAVLAIQDLEDAKMGWAIGKAERVAFLRRYRMKDGSVKTNPGVNNPEIDYPIGEVDERVNVVRFTRRDGRNIVLANFANHPDTVGGCKVSADWPGFTRRIVERALDNTDCLFLNGAQGDVNHVNTFPKGGDWNDLKEDFDDVSRGYGHAHHVGSVVAGAVLQVFDKVKYTDVDEIKYLQKEVSIPSNMPKPEDMAQAHYIWDMHNAGKDDELPYENMLLTTFVAEACRMVELEHGPEAFDLLFSSLAIGPVAFIGFPGEPFSVIGIETKKSEGWELVCPACLTNGANGYFPSMSAYDEGGYEARASRFKAGVAERMIEEGKILLGELKKA